MEEKRLSIVEHFTQQMTSTSQAEMIKYYYYKIMVYEGKQPQAFQALEICLTLLAPKALLDTIKELRAFSYQRESKWRWLEWTPKDLNRIGSKPSIFWLWLTVHPKGYIRELAWQQLAESSVDRKIIFLLYTVNDNVEELRKIAVQQLMKEQLPKEEDLIYSLPFIQRLGGLGHIENRTIQEYMIRQLAVRPDILLAAQQSKDVFIYRYAFELSFLLNGEIRNRSIENGLKKTDKVTLARTFREMIRTAEEKEEQVKKLLNHPQTVIRKLAGSWCYNHLESESAMIPLLLDSAVSIRCLASDYSKKYFPDFDIRSYYLEHLSQYEVNALQGLAMLLDIRDREIFLPRINDPRKNVRLAAIGWLSCLPKDEQVDYYKEALGDISRDVRRKAEEQIGELYPFFYPKLKEELIKQFKASNSEKHQQSILKVLTNESRKEYLFDLFMLYPYGATKDLKEEIEQCIYYWKYEWNRRFFTVFTEAEKEKLLHYEGAIDGLNVGMFLERNGL
ncbi:HEAT repeat domain-containing protein [Enterococcus larvae]|uniref:HEAT repeat domain-containing protein n=1 Tax=Enterococcus larvae TaxID=2794352 RepID=UPI003F3D64C0